MSSGRCSAIGDVEQQLTRVLGGWAAASVALGGALSLSSRTRGFGRQTLAWGAVDGAIAYVGARRRLTKGPTDPLRLRRVLLANAGLDVGYLVAGAWLLRRSRWRGDGLAVLVQGAFLLVLDTTAAERLRAPGIDGRAARLGLSRSEFPRRRLAQEATAATGPVTADDLRGFASVFADLADDELMRDAWK